MDLYKRQRLLGSLLVLLSMVIGALLVWHDRLRLDQIVIGTTKLAIERATTEQQRNLGLSYRLTLPENQGMLFLYQVPTIPTFWMHEMRFALDIVWIAANKVVDITENLAIPSTGTIPTARPNQPIDAVLEVNAGFVKQHDIKVGDRVEYLE